MFVTRLFWVYFIAIQRVWATVYGIFVFVPWKNCCGALWRSRHGKTERYQGL